MALAGATGVSGGSAHTIPALLLPSEEKGWRLTDLTNVTRLGDSKLDNVDCFRIEGGHDNSSTGSKVPREPITVWIDKKNLLVRRIDEHWDGGTVHSTTFEPVIDGSIPNNMLLMNIPTQKK